MFSFCFSLSLFAKFNPRMMLWSRKFNINQNTVFYFSVVNPKSIEANGRLVFSTCNFSTVKIHQCFILTTGWEVQVATICVEQTQYSHPCFWNSCFSQPLLGLGASSQSSLLQISSPFSEQDINFEINLETRGHANEDFHHFFREREGNLRIYLLAYKKS